MKGGSSSESAFGGQDLTSLGGSESTTSFSLTPLVFTDLEA